MTKARTLADFNTSGVLTSTSNLNASKLTSGTIPNARYGTPTFNGSSLTGIEAGGNTPAIMVQKSAGQSVPTGSFTKITWNVEDYDSDGTFTNNRFTPAVAGKYFIHSLLAFDEMADNRVAYAAIYKNGSHAFSGVQGAGTNTTLLTPQVSCVLDLNTTDYIEVYGLHNNGNNRTVIGGSTTEALFLAFKIG